MSRSPRRLPSTFRRSARRARGCVDALIDRWLRVDTRAGWGSLPTDTAHADAKVYESASWIHYHLIVRRLLLGPEDQVVDYGCGAARFLCVAARRGVRRVVGVECSSRLADAARSNLQNLRGRRSEWDVRQEDAAAFNPTGCTVAFLFNPFGDVTLGCVVDALQREAAASGRRITLAYHHPRCRDVLDARPALRLRETLNWRAFLHPTLLYDIYPA